MAVATIRLGRRSKEIVEMTEEEVKNARCKVIEGEKFHIVEVSEQKSSKSGQVSEDFSGTYETFVGRKQAM